MVAGCAIRKIMNRSQSIIQKYYEENSSIDNLGETPKGVIPIGKKKKKRKKVLNTLEKYEKFIDTFPASVTAKKRMSSGKVQVEEGTKTKVLVTEIPESQTFDITFTGKKAKGIFKYDNKEEAELDWRIV
jgi:hypothetical protein